MSEPKSARQHVRKGEPVGLDEALAPDSFRIDHCLGDTDRRWVAGDHLAQFFEGAAL